MSDGLKSFISPRQLWDQVSEETGGSNLVTDVNFIKQITDLVQNPNNFEICLATPIANRQQV